MIILETVIVTSCESNRSGFPPERSKSYWGGGIFQNHLTASTWQINFDVDIDVKRVKKIFGRKHRVLAFSTICAGITLKTSLFQHDFVEIYEISNKR